MSVHLAFSSVTDLISLSRIYIDFFLCSAPLWPTNWEGDCIFTFTFMHLADAFIQSDLHCIQVTVLHFYQLLLSLGIEPMILALLAPCSTIWATGKPSILCAKVTLQSFIISLCQMQEKIRKKMFINKCNRCIIHADTSLNVLLQ